MNASKKLISIFAVCLALASCVSLFSFETVYAAQGDGHTWGETLVCISPTCEEGGYEILLCSDEGCGEKLLVTYDALGHDETLFVTVQPTCEETGTAEIRCSRCGRVREAEILALGHDYAVGEDGEKVCSRCGKALSDEEEYHKPFLWLIIVICVGAVIIAVAIVLGYRSWKKAKAQEAKESETPSADREDGGDGGEEDKDDKDNDS